MSAEALPLPAEMPGPAGGVPVLEFHETALPLSHMRAECALRGAEGEDVIVHFYATEGMRPTVWRDRFPEFFSDFAMAFWGAGPERLSAEHIHELAIDSWCFLARGYGKEAFLSARLVRFFAELDAGFARSLNAA